MKFKTEREQLKYEDAKKAYAALMKFYPFTTESLEGEEWKPIPNYPKHAGSNFGRIKSFCKGRVKILKPSLASNGYLCINIHEGDKSKWASIHQLVGELFIPNPEGKPEINHKDGCKLNSYVGNLEWVTDSENQQHAYDTGLRLQGVDHSNAKIKNEEDIVYIRENPDNLSQKQLAEKFGVDKGIIRNIQLGESYKNCGGKIRKKIDNHVPGEQRTEIRRRYKKGSREFGTVALAKQFGYSQSEIWNIINKK